jgi:hypothetical protein
VKRTFKLGRLVVTAGALAACVSNGVHPLSLIERHACPAPGDHYLTNFCANEEALERGLSLISAFNLQNGMRVWVITAADGNTTTVLMPEDYQLWAESNLNGDETRRLFKLAV